MIGSVVRALMAFCLMVTIAGAAGAEPGKAAPIFYRSVKVDGLSIFYREAGPANAPTLLLLHGFPSSSRMFDPLFARLADHVHLIAPDYPGFGHSDAPDPKTFVYTFDHIADVIGHFTDAIGTTHYFLYLQDYGGPVGFRLALAHPERVRGLTIQNAVAHEDGLGPSWEARRQFWRDRPAHEAAFQKAFLSFETTRKRHIGASPDAVNYDPDLWTDEFAFLSRPGETEIQTDLFYDYRTNELRFAAWQAWIKQARPPTLVVWGRYGAAHRRRGAPLGGRLVSGRGLSSVENEVWGARVTHLVRKAAAYGTLADNVRTDMRQVRRRSSRSRAVSFGSIFLSGRRWTPGTVPATSQLSWRVRLPQPKCCPARTEQRQLLRSSSREALSR